MGRKQGERDRQARILRFWRAVEYFSPPKVEAVDHRNLMFEVRRGRPLPWEPGGLNARKPKRDRVWRHTVYAGVFAIADVRPVLERAFEFTESERELGSGTGDSALLSFAVDDKGRLLSGTATLSGCGWAVGRTLSPGPDDTKWLDGFDAAQDIVRKVALGIGTGKVPVASSDRAERRGRALGLIAGAGARVAIDLATGGLTAIPAVLGVVASPALGQAGAKAVEKVGDAFAKDAAEATKSAIERRRDGKSGDASGPGDTGTPAAAPGKILDVDDLVAITRWLAEELGVAEALQPNSIRVKCVEVKPNEPPSTNEILNSFYVDDLKLVADAAESGDIGVALSDFLRAEDEVGAARRVDVRERPDMVLGALTPGAMPTGRWPAAPDRPLAASQQFAVNDAVDRLMSPQARGVYAVNGPPGTGKTTMLRDLIAAIVVERAGRLATLGSARDAFAGDPLTWPTESGWNRRLYPLRPDLAGFEIVVASANNGAVENVTREVPAEKSIDRATFPGAEYLSGPATLATGVPCWGAVAAVLGNRGNRRHFSDAFWWTDPARPCSGSKPGEEAEPDETPCGLHILLRGLEDGAGERVIWSEAVARFREARTAVDRLARTRTELLAMHTRHAGSDETLEGLKKQVQRCGDLARKLRVERAGLMMSVANAAECARQARVAADAAVDDCRRASDAVDDAKSARDAATATLQGHQSSKPGWWRRLRSWRVYSAWQAQNAELVGEARAAAQRVTDAQAHVSELAGTSRDRAGEADAAKADLSAREKRVSRCDNDIAQADRDMQAAADAVARREDELRAEAELLARARARWPIAIPGSEWTAAPDDVAAMRRRELSAPWMDEEFAAARSRLFLAALDLHWAVSTNEPALMRRNLNAVMDVVRGEVPAGFPAEKALAAWQMLFFVVPVVSTTFASLSRMFAGLGREALGWLFVDEAGQAVPQASIGALWRTQRAVVVGDPRQLEPIVSLPMAGQYKLADHFRVDRAWAPGSTSVQQIADRLNVHGTWLPEPGSGGRTWVGSPLRVHRRCDRLMFEVSNAIAYDHMMVYGASDPAEPDLVDASVWIDVPAGPTGGKWNPEEGRCVRDLLLDIRDRVEQRMHREVQQSNDPPPWSLDEELWREELQRRFAESVFVVSPFRDVVRGLRQTLSNLLPARLERVGTVHVTQGKEAEVVILVLGTSDEQSGSRGWAAGRPNLLNVAATRAKRRLVIVGDHGNWSGLRHFNVLAQHPNLVVERPRIRP
ncbi:DEAD/DEAH box helicase [Nocardia terpenica]|uniref:DEAD/DEAH box helicase n=1 Tax=Nocardia terpenica TaxID=455432 RepID=UPI0012FD743C|nr:ATP-binding protein [Nocardia terpenica]